MLSEAQKKQKTQQHLTYVIDEIWPYSAQNTSIPSEIIELRTPLGRWTQGKIEFDQNKCVFDILSFNNFVFAWTELRSAASNIRDWWDLAVQCSKYLYSKWNHRIANPFGAMDARKKSMSIKKMRFRHFVIQHVWMRWNFSKKLSNFGRSFTPWGCLRLAWKFVDMFFRRYCKKSVPRIFLDEVGFFGKNVNFRKVVYPPRMSPFGLKICVRAFQTILQKKCSQDFFGRGGIFRKK